MLEALEPVSQVFEAVHRFWKTPELADIAQRGIVDRRRRAFTFDRMLSAKSIDVIVAESPSLFKAGGLEPNVMDKLTPYPAIVENTLKRKRTHDKRQICRQDESGSRRNSLMGVCCLRANTQDLQSASFGVFEQVDSRERRGSESLEEQVDPGGCIRIFRRAAPGRPQRRRARGERRTGATETAARKKAAEPEAETEKKPLEVAGQSRRKTTTKIEQR